MKAKGNQPKRPTAFKTFLFPLALVFILALQTLHGAQTISGKGDYFLFSDDMEYMFGGGKITLKGGNKIITGDGFYMDVKQTRGVLYGNVAVRDKVTGKAGSVEHYDAVFFQDIPPKFLMITYGDTISYSGDISLESAFTNFIKHKPKTLKEGSLYFEFREFRMDKNRKIKAKLVIPYMMGLPTVPLKRFTVNRGNWADKTMLAFNSVNYTGVDGLSLSLFLRLREKILQGDYNIKLYERKLFNMEGIKRGILFSGNTGLKVKTNELLRLDTLLNSGDQSFNLKLRHQQSFKYVEYSLSQNISGREKVDPFFEFAASVTLKPFRLIAPQADFTHNLKNSHSYGVSTPLRLLKKLNLRFGWNRRILKENYLSDNTAFTSSLGYDHKLLNLSSNYNFSRNLVDASTRKNFSINIKSKPVYFLEKNVTVDVAGVYMFSAIPMGEEIRTRITPGVAFGIHSAGARLPLGFTLVPSFTFNHLWDNRQESFTDFNYSLALQKEMGYFTASLAYALASRYRAENFWIEGSGMQNMVLNLKLDNSRTYAFLMRFYFNDKTMLENISLNGDLRLPLAMRLSTFVLYYHQEKQFNTVEIFLEKVFKKKIKIQGGYSLALKRFFIKFLTQ